ncbi:hypothetical protein GCM10009735_75070 [Actinomadura chokoriensis]
MLQGKRGPASLLRGLSREAGRTVTTDNPIPQPGLCVTAGNEGRTQSPPHEVVPLAVAAPPTLGVVVPRAPPGTGQNNNPEPDMIIGPAGVDP